MTNGRIIRTLRGDLVRASKPAPIELAELLTLFCELAGDEVAVPIMLHHLSGMETLPLDYIEGIIQVLGHCKNAKASAALRNVMTDVLAPVGYELSAGGKKEVRYHLPYSLGVAYVGALENQQDLNTLIKVEEFARLKQEPNLRENARTAIRRFLRVPN